MIYWSSNKDRFRAKKGVVSYWFYRDNQPIIVLHFSLYEVRSVFLKCHELVFIITNNGKCPNKIHKYF